MVEDFRKVGAMPVDVANKLIIRLAADGDVNRPSMTEQTYGEMIDEINKAGRLAQQGKKPEAKPTEKTPAQKRDAASKAYTDAVTEFTKGLNLKQQNQWTKSGDVSKMGLNSAQGALYERMEELRGEFETAVEAHNSNATDKLAKDSDEETDLNDPLNRSGITDPAKLTESVEILEDQTEPTLTPEQMKTWLKNPRSPLELLDLIARSSDNPSYRYIARMIRPLLTRLINSGTLVMPVPVTTRTSKVDGLTAFTYTQKTVEASINLSKTDYETALHELIHLAFEPMMELAKTAYERGDKNELSRLYADYKKLGDHIGSQLVRIANENTQAINALESNLASKGLGIQEQKEFTARLKASIGKIFSQNIFKRKGYKPVGYDIREIFTWAMTNKDSQIVLESMPSIMGESPFKKFVNLVRKVLGLPGSINSALSDILGMSERIATISFPNNIVDISFNKLAGKKLTAEARRTPPRRRIPAPPRAPKTLEETTKDSAAGLRELMQKRGSPKETLKYIFSNEFYNDTVRNLVNNRRVLQELERGLEYGKKLIYGFNDFYSQIITSSGKTWNIFSSRFMDDTDRLESLVRKYADDNNLPMEEALGFLSNMLAAMHYKERRRTLHMIFAPLKNDVKEYQLTLDDGSTIDVSAAKLRSAILEQARSNKNLTDAQMTLYRNKLEELTDINNPNNRLDPNGVSQADNPGEPRKVGISKYSIDVNADEYAPLPMDEAVVNELLDYRTNNAAKVDEIIKLVNKIIDKQKETDKDSHFWTQSVDNLTRLYNWQNYVPLKGRLPKGVKENPLNNAIDLRGKSVSPEFAADIPQGITGRSEDEQMNVILQVQRDAVKSSIRLGQMLSRMTIRNAIRQGIIKDNKRMRLVIKPEDRYKGFEAAKYQKNDWFVYYAPDGNLELYKLTDERQKNAIRQIYGADQLNKALQLLSTANAWVSKNFTRFNLRFAPKDFVRNAIFAAGIFGFEGGPKKVGQFMAAITARMAKGGLRKSWKMWKLYEAGKLETEGKRLSLTDPAYKSAYEYLHRGGAVTYVQQFAGRSKIANAIESYSRSKKRLAYDKAANVISLFLDTWVQAFEMNVRTVAYDMYKKDFLDAGLSEETAQGAAAAKAKDLTNFEQVGEKAHTLRALYAFFSASGTGAARTLDAIRPVLIKDAGTFLEELPDSIKTDPIALRNAEKKLKQDKKNAYATGALGLGVGLLLYSMTRMMSGDDELDRNLVGIDKKEQWVRTLRIPLSALGIQEEEGMDVVSIPWGFGWGAFLAAGAQLGALLWGDQSLRSYIGNNLQIATDSFGVFPFARFNPFDETTKEGSATLAMKWVADSVTPSLFRPGMEWIMNLNGLGQELYSEARSSYGGAGTTSESVPEFYNQFASWMEDTFGAETKPESYYFVMGNYFSAFGGAISTTYGLYSWATGQKDFSPSRDTPILGAFFGRRSTPDAGDYIKMGLRVERQERLLKDMLKRGRTDAYYEYLDKHPYALTMISDYNQRKSAINKVQEVKTLVQNGGIPSETIRERSDRVKFYTDRLNIMKYSAVEANKEWEELSEEAGE